VSEFRHRSSTKRPLTVNGAVFLLHAPSGRKIATIALIAISML
jgi:hypothetical protein